MDVMNGMDRFIGMCTKYIIMLKVLLYQDMIVFLTNNMVKLQIESWCSRMVSSFSNNIILLPVPLILPFNWKDIIL